MRRYARNPNALINDVASGITLRCDVHCRLDLHGFIFLPAGNKQFMTYVIDGNEIDYADLFHQRL